MVTRCPQCTLRIPTPRPSLCPSCKYPLLLSIEPETKTMAGPVLRRPSDPVVKPPVRPPPLTAAQPEPVCPACGFANLVGTTRCRRCDKDLSGASNLRPNDRKNP